MLRFVSGMSSEKSVSDGSSGKGSRKRNISLELTGRTLKLAALIFMVLDHIGVVIVERGILKSGDPLSMMQVMQTPSGKNWWYADRILRCAGRPAFPIYVFLLVEGFVHTRHRKAYGRRLFFFALLSEIPFDLAVFGQWFYPAYQNVMFTLLIAYLTLCAVQKFQKSFIMQLLCPLAGCFAAELFSVDYGAMGVLFAVLLYLFRESKIQLGVAAVIGALNSLSQYGTAAISVLFMKFYRGKEGKWPGKYFFYFAYPGHLLILSALYQVLFA